MDKKTIYYMMEPSNVTFAWMAKCCRNLFELATQKRYQVYQLELESIFDSNLYSFPVIVFSTTNQWTKYAIDCLKSKDMKPIVIGIISDMFNEDISCVTMNRHAFIEDIIRYFVYYGHKHPALFGINRQISNDMYRAESFLRIGREFHLDISEKNIFFIGEDCEDLENTAQNFLHHCHLYDGVICMNDFWALYLLSLASEFQISIPEDLWLSGYGDYSIASCSAPSITTAAINTQALALQAFHIYKLLLNSNEVSHIVTSVNSKIIPRESTAFQPVPTYSSNGSEIPMQSSSRILTDPVQTLHSIENCLYQCDEIDIKILIYILDGYSYETIESKLFMSYGAIHYRARKLFQTLGAANRSEFVEIMKQYKIQSQNIHLEKEHLF